MHRQPALPAVGWIATHAPMLLTPTSLQLRQLNVALSALIFNVFVAVLSLGLLCGRSVQGKMEQDTTIPLFHAKHARACSGCGPDQGSSPGRIASTSPDPGSGLHTHAVCGVADYRNWHGWHSSTCWLQGISPWYGQQAKQTPPVQSATTDTH